MSDPRVAIVGIGVMGGSLGLALRRAGAAAGIVGFDPDPACRQTAVRMGVVDDVADTLEDAVSGADVVVIAAPVGVTAELARRALAGTGEDCLVSDIASSKAGVMGALNATERERFIGGHPICGSERGGVEHARAEMFDGATYFLTPAPETRPDLYERLHGLVTRIGARPSAIDADAHDRILALVSHLPHVIASTLIQQAASTTPGGREALRSAGPSFADLTRVAGANPPLWADILLANADAVAEAIDDHVARLSDVAHLVRSGDRAAIHDLIANAADGRARLREAPDALAEPWRVVVDMPNRPGVISQVATALGHAHVNIEDLQLRSGAGLNQGELSLVVSGERAMRTAVNCVERLGFVVRAQRIGLEG